MSSRGNSKLYYSRRNKIIRTGSLGKYKKKSKSRSPRVPKMKKRESPRHHSDLFTDENKKKTIKGLRFRTEKEAKESVKKIRELYKNNKISYAHAKQAALAMEQRSRFHSRPTTEIKRANKVWSKFIKSF